MPNNPITAAVIAETEKVKMNQTKCGITFPVSVMGGCGWNLLDHTGRRIAICGGDSNRDWETFGPAIALLIKRALNEYAQDNPPSEVHPDGVGELTASERDALDCLDMTHLLGTPRQAFRHAARRLIQVRKDNDALARTAAEQRQEIEKLRNGMESIYKLAETCHWDILAPTMVKIMELTGLED